MDNKELALGHIKHGVIVGLIIWGITAGSVIIGYLSEGQNGNPAYHDPWLWFEIALFLLLIWGMTRKSRAAAALVFFYYMFNLLLTLAERFNIWTLAIGLTVLFFFAKSIVGCFNYHNEKKAENSEYNPNKWWMWALPTPFVLFGLWLMGMSLMEKWGWVPARYVKSYQEVTVKERQLLLDWGVIGADEQIDKFYSFGQYSYREGGTVLTNQRLIGYWENEDESLSIGALSFDEIDKIVTMSPGDDFEDGVYVAWPKNKDHQEFYYFLSTQNSGDQVFMQKLNTLLAPPEPHSRMPVPTMGQ